MGMLLNITSKSSMKRIKKQLRQLELTVSITRNNRELIKPPKIVSNSEDANFSLYISRSEIIMANRSNEYSMDLPGPVMTTSLIKKTMSDLISIVK